MIQDVKNRMAFAMSMQSAKCGIMKILREIIYSARKNGWNAMKLRFYVKLILKFLNLSVTSIVFSMYNLATL